LAQVAPGARANVLDALLAYYQYRVTAQMPSPSPQLREQKDVLLRARLQAAPADKPIAVPPPVPSPASGSAPMLLGGGVGVDHRGRTLGAMRWAAYSNDLLGRHGIDGGELVVMDTSVYARRGAGVALNRLDVIRVRRLSVQADQPAAEKPVSWHVRVGAERGVLDRTSKVERTFALGRFGVGYATSLFGASNSGPLRVSGWAMVDGVVRSGGWSLAAEPNVGILARRGPWSALVQGSARYELEPRQWQLQWTAEANYMLSQHRSVRIELRPDVAVRAMLGVRQYL